MDVLTWVRAMMKGLYGGIRHWLSVRIYVGTPMSEVPGHSLILFPIYQSLLCCGLAGIVAYKHTATDRVPTVDSDALIHLMNCVEQAGFTQTMEAHGKIREDTYLGGSSVVDRFLEVSRSLKRSRVFVEIFNNSDIRRQIATIAGRLSEFIDTESGMIAAQMGRLSTPEVELATGALEKLKDIAWCLSREIDANIDRVQELMPRKKGSPSDDTIIVYRNINAVLNSIDRLEVRGRDSAGISLMFVLSRTDYEQLRQQLEKQSLWEKVQPRISGPVLENQSIRIGKTDDGYAITFTYKVAAEIGSLGDNVAYLRKQIREDQIFHTTAAFPHLFHTVISHTRWASVGGITVSNCHPVDNRLEGDKMEISNSIHVCLNGDIDNYLQLRSQLESQGYRIPPEIDTDTKIIPIQIENYIRKGYDIGEAFRLAVNDFEGSHAICMHSDLSPGKVYLAQKGSGQAVFVGMAPDHYIPASEVYGVVEETPQFLKLDGEKVIQGKNGETQGQIFILDQNSAGSLDGISAMYYDGTELKLDDTHLKSTEITSRDIDRQEYSHYFLKEISESPTSVENTIQNRWKESEANPGILSVVLDDRVVPESLKQALTGQNPDVPPIRRIYFVGQGTAGVAAQACADILNYYMADPGVFISSLKASELSGFKLYDDPGSNSMNDTLVVAISQSGTTTDTNRTVDMVRERGAHTLAIVNRRDSDITFKVDGVMYTSSGRDIEMSVASTKAFYSQIVAGALLGLYLAQLRGRRDEVFISNEIKQLLSIPEHMRKVLRLRDRIRESAQSTAMSRTYWAAVGSGPNKTSADEIRIKLSELCYKTISSDFVEDKKHIDLSSEPLIIVCAAGTRESVLGDIIKDTAIFRAHKAVPIVIADEGEDRFRNYAVDVFHVPKVSEHFAPILNTLVGHIWGYYAALTINDGSKFLYDFREQIYNAVDESAKKGMDVYELILEKDFRETIASFYPEFREKLALGGLSMAMGFEGFSDLTLLLKYLTGRLPITDFDQDFRIKGTALNMLNRLFECLSNSIKAMARPIDAIKHQAKTVTVGTSRISEKAVGILFDALSKLHFKISQLTASNVNVLKNLQGVVAGIKGTTVYRIDRLNLLGEPTDETTIAVTHRSGTSSLMASRTEADPYLKGSKRIVVRQGNVYIGKGRKDGRSIVLIPVMSDSVSAPNRIEHLVLFNVYFKDNVALSTRIKALGGKYEHIKNIVQETISEWQDEYLEWVDIEELFGRSAEKIGESIIAERNLQQ